MRRHGPATLAAVQGHVVAALPDRTLVDATADGLARMAGRRQAERARWWLAWGGLVLGVLALCQTCGGAP